MLFYFVRHGQTEANRNHILQGCGIDHPLNDEGHAQAQRLAKSICQTVGHPIARIVVSDMVRARQTAQYLAEAFQLPLQIKGELREWHLGEWEGQSFMEYGRLLLEDGEPKLGESRKVFYERVGKAWREVHSDNEPYLIVSHGAVWMALQDALQIPRFKVSNCDLVKVQSNGSAWSAEILTLK